MPIDEIRVNDLIDACVYYAFHQSFGIVGGSYIRANYCNNLIELLSAKGAIVRHSNESKIIESEAKAQRTHHLTRGELHVLMAKAEQKSGQMRAGFADHLKMANRVLSALQEADYRVARADAG